MPEGKGKKAKKPRWQVVLGLKQIMIGGLGIGWMMIIIFILGVLAGRGDIYRWLSAWGLVSPEAPKVVQWSPPADPSAGTPPGATPVAAPGAAPGAAPAPTANTAAPAPAHAPAHTTAAAPAAGPQARAKTPTVTGSIIGAPGAPPSPAKKVKKQTAARDLKAKEEEVRRLCQEVAPKLRFQNSFDTPAKSARTGAKHKEKAATPQTIQVKVARYRDAKSAKAKMAELQKKGEKVSLKKGKDHEGAFFDVVRKAPAAPREPEQLARRSQKPAIKKPESKKLESKKSEGKKHKPQTQVRHQ